MTSKIDINTIVFTMDLNDTTENSEEINIKRFPLIVVPMHHKKSTLN